MFAVSRCWLLICAFAVLTNAQGVTLIGRVTDPSGAVLPKVTVTAVNSATDVSSVAATNEEGYYVIPYLPIGRYAVTAEAAGFTAERRTDLLLQVGQTVRVDFELKLGEVGTKIEVQASLPVVQTETSSVGAVVDSRQILGVPLNGRGLFALLALAPGVQRAGSNASIGGAPGNMVTNFTVDGTTNNDVISARLESAHPSLDTVAEFEVLNVNAPAEFGRGGAQIRLVTRSGTNEFHGSLYEYNRNRHFAARNFFALTRPPYNRNEFGGSLGGPLWVPRVYSGKNRTFFFFSYEGMRARSPRTNTMAVPTAAQRGGDFSGLGPIRDPFTQQPFPSGRVPADRLSPVAKALLEYYPLPNLSGTGPAGTGFNYSTTLSSKPVLDNWSLRIDHVFDSKNRIFGRYFAYTNGPDFVAGPNWEKFGNGYSGVSQRNASLSYTCVMSGRLINEFRFGYVFSDNFRNTGNPDLDLSHLIPGLPPITRGAGGVPSMDITGLTALTENSGTYSGGFFRQWSHQYIDNLTFVSGRHILKTGFDMNFSKAYDGLAIRPYPRGNFVFRGTFTANAVADFLLGWPLTAQRSSPYFGSTQPGASVLGYYVQTDSKITPKLTLNIGVRYELNTRWDERDKQFANFDLKTGKIVVPTMDGQIARGAIPRLVETLPIITAEQAGFPSKLIRGDHNNIAPRFGFAYRLTPKTVLRGGYGIYFGTLFGAQVLAASKNPPFVLTEVVESASGAVPSLSFTQAFPRPGSIPANPSFTAFDPDLKNTYTQQWNLTIERQLPADTGLRVTYLGNQILNTWRAYDINQQREFGPGPIQPRRPYQPFSTILYYDSGGKQIAHSLQVGALKRFSHGLLYQVEYQWVRVIGEDLFGGPQDIRNFRADRADITGMARHAFRANYLYDLPFGSGRRWLAGAGPVLGRILGGWQIGGITSVLSGLPFSVLYTSRILGSPSGRADVVGDPRVPNPTIEGWFNPAAFAVPAAFTFGNSGKNILGGPGSVTFDVALYKNIPLTERFNLQFRSESFNLMNKANFGLPANNISVPAAVGRITSAADARIIQFGLRLVF